MNKFEIKGSRQLNGEIKIQGAKNSILPILAATLLCEDECIINNCPHISDVDTAVEILLHLGCDVNFKNNVLRVNTKNLTKYDIPENLMRKMRSSIIFLGALIARTGFAKATLPGGCEIGPRPINLHVDGFKQLGIAVTESGGVIECEIQKINRSFSITLPFPSVGATENLMLASLACDGTTVLHNVAREPEIIDLAEFLNKIGAQIFGAGESDIIISGNKKFHGTYHTVIPDRIVAITYMCAAAVTNGHLILHDISSKYINSSISVFEESGCFIKEYNNKIEIVSPEKLQSVKSIRTMAYPGFPTDAQAPVMSSLLLANGTSVFVETIFKSRYKHVGELLRLGADIKVEGHVAIVEGVSKLSGANVTASDLRGGAALIIAAIAAEGTSIISNIKYVQRGYENITEILNDVGGCAKII
ncbi:MAG: UDP-N-acetylglucosamine 1-carboxyvinyltransferase [Candidatus Improbicoccus devescovinae]|nr:MAG: UDP-N-acetylglucosamine 1-carboxyvinyltransferase [Candidatus Improbicoccus devescovinae]